MKMRIELPLRLVQLSFIPLRDLAVYVATFDHFSLQPATSHLEGKVVILYEVLSMMSLLSGVWRSWLDHLGRLCLLAFFHHCTGNDIHVGVVAFVWRLED